jgi:hypothetical protein
MNIFLFVPILNARYSLEHRLGVAYSYLQKSNNDMKPGFVYGIIRERQSNKCLSYQYGVLLSIQNGSLLNESVEHNKDPFRIIVRKININYRLAFIKIPFNVRYKFNFNKNLSITLESGPQFNLSIYNSASGSVIILEYYPKEEMKNYPFSARIDDYRGWTVQKNSGFDLNIGVNAILNRFGIGFLFSYPLNHIYNVGNYTIDRQMETISMFLLYKIN